MCIGGKNNTLPQKTGQEGYGEKTGSRIKRPLALPYNRFSGMGKQGSRNVNAFQRGRRDVWTEIRAIFRCPEENCRFPCNFYSDFFFPLLKKVRFDVTIMPKLIVHLAPFSVLA